MVDVVGKGKSPVMFIFLSVSHGEQNSKGSTVVWPKSDISILVIKKKKVTELTCTSCFLFYFYFTVSLWAVFYVLSDFHYVSGPFDFWELCSPAWVFSACALLLGTCSPSAGERQSQRQASPPIQCWLAVAPELVGLNLKSIFCIRLHLYLWFNMMKIGPHPPQRSVRKLTASPICHYSRWTFSSQWNTSWSWVITDHALQAPMQKKKAN